MARAEAPIRRPGLVTDPTCAIVLAGGRSTRFGSDKSLALLRGEPLLAHVLRACAKRFADVLLVAKEPSRYGSFSGNARLIRDRALVSTPLAGIEAGLAVSTAEIAFCCGGDMPFAVDPSLLEALFAFATALRGVPAGDLSARGHRRSPRGVGRPETAPRRGAHRTGALGGRKAVSRR
ncbi:MAG: molybdenum cofactor guanylyltransferase [Deltaproteobacteria bacterium]|nr:MAG: molybdenum cofactor guanylyltransferase [Deltaproteobacteria bacterium]